MQTSMYRIEWRKHACDTWQLYELRADHAEALNTLAMLRHLGHDARLTGSED